MAQMHVPILVDWDDIKDHMAKSDIVEVVRCKDCKHRDPEDKKCDCGHDILWQLPRLDDWFCADAERRTDALETVIDQLNENGCGITRNEYKLIDRVLFEIPTIEPERKKDTIQKFHDYQVEWMLSHCDLELDPQLEKWVVRFLHDTANCYMMEIDMEDTIEPERKKGKWEITEAYPHNVYCSECHKKFAQTHWAVWEDGSLPRNYCPNCGASMGCEEEE